MLQIAFGSQLWLILIPSVTCFYRQLNETFLPVFRGRQKSFLHLERERGSLYSTASSENYNKPEEDARCQNLQRQNGAPQNLSSVSRSLYNKTAFGDYQSRGWCAPSVDRWEQQQTCPLHQGAPSGKSSTSTAPSSSVLCSEAPSIPHSQIWKTHLCQVLAEEPLERRCWREEAWGWVG